MQTTIVDYSFGQAWMRLLDTLHHRGEKVSPRGIDIREITGVTLKVENGLFNVFHNSARNLNYRFMVAEWLWIWFGHQDVETIAQYNSQIRQFSDNGVFFDGAYGPPVVKQWPYILGMLQRDLDSRQAVIQIYRQPERITRDVPCTLSVQFLVRRNKVETIVCMRSSDIWLGLPYDFYNFSQMANILAGILRVDVGSVTFHLGSSHLYQRNVEAAIDVLHRRVDIYESARLPGAPPAALDGVLMVPQQTQSFMQPWRFFCQVLQGTRADAQRMFFNV